MIKFSERAAAALDRLPEDMQESAVSYILEQADKFEALKREIQLGIDDFEAGRVRQWDFDDFLRRARDAARIS